MLKNMFIKNMISEMVGRFLNSRYENNGLCFVEEVDFDYDELEFINNDVELVVCYSIWREEKVVDYLYVLFDDEEVHFMIYDEDIKDYKDYSYSNIEMIKGMRDEDEKRR